MLVWVLATRRELPCRLMFSCHEPFYHQWSESSWSGVLAQYGPIPDVADEPTTIMRLFCNYWINMGSKWIDWRAGCLAETSPGTGQIQRPSSADLASACFYACTQPVTSCGSCLSARPVTLIHKPPIKAPARGAEVLPDLAYLPRSRHQ